MLASWPLTSGATRISVVRTTPTIDGGVSGRKSRYPPTPAAITTMPSAVMVADPRLAMQLPPLDEKRGNHRKHEVDSGKGPEAEPVMRHLPQAGAQLIDSDEALDGEVRGEYGARGKHGHGDRFARPRKAGHEELRKARAEEDERRSLGVLEPGTRRLAHEAGRENEDRRQREQLQGLAERGKAVDARQHDEVERERRQQDGQMRDAAAKHARERSAQTLRQRDHRQH